MAGSSTRSTFMDFKITDIGNEVLDNATVGQSSSCDDSYFDDDFTTISNLWNTICNSDSVNYGDVQRTGMYKICYRSRALSVVFKCLC